MTKTKHLISRGMNRKLKAGGIVVFNLPTGISCGRMCADCYSARQEKLYKTALAKRLWNLEQSKMPDFADRIIQELTTGHCKNNPIMRWQEGGEFYSQEYVDKVTQVVRSVPAKTFYAYTKRLQEFDFSNLRALSNMILIDSCKYGPVNYGDPAEVATWKALGAYVCPVTKATKGITCNSGCTICTDPANKAGLEARGVVFHKH